MIIFELLKAALFGIVEGISEWLPISSTGHMLLLNEYLPLDVSKSFWDMFLVVIQLGAILAVLILFFHELNPLSPKKSTSQKRSTLRLWAQIIVACIPAALIGLPLDDIIAKYLGSPLIIAAALFVYGVIFIFIERRRSSSFGTHIRRINDIEHMDWKTAVGIGCFQVLSVVPGTSRSGSTIIGGLLCGCSRSLAAEFSFYLAIPTMIGASGLRLVKYFLKGNMFSQTELLILGVGCLVAFVVSLVAIRFLMNFVKKHDFAAFGWYRIVLAVLVLIYFVLLH